MYFGLRIICLRRAADDSKLFRYISGAILGPLLFIIYVNDIQETCILGSDLYVYTDDSKLFRYISGENDSLPLVLQSDLNSLSDWFKKWLLKLNINKCTVVLFGINVIIAQ